MNHLIKKIKLGEVDYYGQHATVYREIYTDGIWKFVVIADNTRIVLMSY